MPGLADLAETLLHLKLVTSATYITRVRPYRTMANVISGVVITFSNITEQKRQHEHLQVLMKELQHRTNNLFTVIQAMARQTARSSATFTEFEAQFGTRRAAFAAASGLETQKKAAADVQRRAIEIGTAANLGIFFVPVGYRDNIKGMIPSPVQFFWNMEKVSA
jgi:hypothetical protein